ncbi:hypothetical protein QBC32DRAFT_131347 [Pseudoneurospora amorphoporcata]|uniref:Pre-rRNA processing protein n=1 Tax=Pseudoneurospora amorphoporcata TaxID=241081 RepID=A0AAN6NXL6_9PEZI|nr:hypothetical protein QBC32DRAFT_131347 [Pseudoneurospora amorphoporcata]
MSSSDCDSERSPLLAASTSSRDSKTLADSIDGALESTPLLSTSNTTPRYNGERDDPDRASLASTGAFHSGDAESPAGSTNKSTRWPSIIAALVLMVLAASIAIGAFFVPAAVEEYAKESIVIEPTNLALESITTDGVRARIQANFRLDATRVKNVHVRRVGQFTTWLAKELATEETRVKVYWIDHDNMLLGTAGLPPLTITIANGHNTELDIVADLAPGDSDTIRTIANQFLAGKMDTIRVRGTTDVTVKTRFNIPLGTHAVSETMEFEGKELPPLPSYNITGLNFEERPLPDGDKEGMAADVTITSFNPYPIAFDVPSLKFEVLVPGCKKHGPAISVVTAVSDVIALRPEADVAVTAHSIVEELPEPLTRPCPGGTMSPLDKLFEAYLAGQPAFVLVRGQKEQGGEAPGWIGDIISSVTVPVPLPQQSFDDLIRNFSLTDVSLSLPDPLADPDDLDSNPKVSGTIVALAALPSELNIGLNVSHVQAKADVFYHSRKLGELEIGEKASSIQIEGGPGEENLIEITSRVHDTPLKVTDDDVLTDVIQALLFGDVNVILDISALVDVGVHTILGQFVVKGVPAEGRIPLKPLGNDLLGSMQPQVGNLEVVDTSPVSISLQASVNVTNPTPYAAYIPWVSIHILNNGTVLGEARAKRLTIKRGVNTNLKVTAVWRPSLEEEDGQQIGRDLISQYISGYNTTVTLKIHPGTIPSKPELGKALSKLNFTLPMPRLNVPGDNEGGRHDGNGSANDTAPHFIRGASFHVFSSTATFTLASPFSRNTIYIEHINATALYNHTEEIGRIKYDSPFGCPPGVTTTPRLPVDWSLDSVGRDKLKETFGGRLKLDAKATVKVRIGSWTETLWYIGRGIGASVRL